jgi:hypothetical protein
MAMPYYAYLVLKMPGPHGIISIREMSSRLSTAIERATRLLTDC